MYMHTSFFIHLINWANDLLKPKYLNYSLNTLLQKSTEFYMNTGEAENTRTNLFGRWRHQYTLKEQLIIYYLIIKTNT